jgi:hypothetical protein
MIRKLQSGRYRLYSHERDRRTGRHRNLGTFVTREAAEQHERAVQSFTEALMVLTRPPEERRKDRRWPLIAAVIRKRACLLHWG